MSLSPAYGREITAKGEITLEHFEYVPATDLLEGDRSIETILDSFMLAEQHTISSGGENIFFQNNSSKIDYYSLLGGLKDQEIPINQTSAGLIIPFARSYSKNMLNFEVNGPALASGFVGFTSTDSLPFDVVGLGFEIIVEERILPTDKLEFNIHFGTSSSGVQIFAQRLTNIDLFPTARLIWWFTHPTEGKLGQTLYTEVLLNGSILKVRPGTNDPLKPYRLGHQRLSNDLPVILRADGGSNTTYKLLKLLDTTGPNKGDIVLVAHGIDHTKIVSLAATIIDDNGEVTGPGSKSTGNSEYFIKADDTNVIVTTSQAFGGDVLSKPFQILITYED